MTWNQPRTDYEPEYLDKYYHFDDGDGRLYWRADLCAGGVRHGSSGMPWRGINPTDKGMHWKFTVEHLDELDAEGRIYWPANGTMPQYKRYRDELKGKAVADIWDDIDRINPVAAERLGYPTQKPEALLERIVRASSNEGDVILDPFCGCGTAVSVAQRLRRHWIGIDITYIALTLIRSRLRHAFGDTIIGTYDVTGEPTTLSEAQQLAKENPWQFQLWALGKVDARPEQVKKGADQGADGRLFFHVPPDVETHQVVLSVKGGQNIGPDYVRDLAGVIGRDNAEIGVLVTLEPPSPKMSDEAASHGTYVTAWGRHPRIQILTIADLLSGKRIDMPPPSQVGLTFKRAPKATREASHIQGSLLVETS